MKRRSQCGVCGYPEAMCLCAWITPQSLPVRVIIVQDRLEQKQAKSTVPLLRLALPSLEWVNAGDRATMAALHDAMVEDSGGWGLVYPGREAVAIDAQSNDCNERRLPAVWVLPDGTWRKTRKLLYDHPWLGRLPRYTFDQAPASEYLIRRVPDAGALSTLESVAWLLRHVTALDTTPLYCLQRAFVDRWQAHQPKAHRRQQEGN